LHLINHSDSEDIMKVSCKLLSRGWHAVFFFKPRTGLMKWVSPAGKYLAHLARTSQGFTSIKRRTCAF